MSKRPAHKAEPPATLSVPGVRAEISEVGAPAAASPPPKPTKPRKRKAKFVF